MLRRFITNGPHSSFSSCCSSFQTLLASTLPKCRTIERIQQAHAFMIAASLHEDEALISQFLESCVSLGFINYALNVFDRNLKQDIRLYNAMIRALSRSNYTQKAVFLYNKIQSSGLRPNTYSFPFVLGAVSRLGAIELGRQVHCQCIGIGLERNDHVLTALVKMYSSFGAVDDAKKVFDEKKSGYVALWNAMVSGFMKAGNTDSALKLFDKMPQRNVISWTTVISGLAQLNKADEALGFFRRMLVEGMVPDEVTMLAALSACAQLGALALGEWIHGYIDRYGVHKTVALNNALIDMYAKSGRMSEAAWVFEGVQHKSIVTWTTMIAGLALNGMGKEALEMFSRMEMAGVKPNEITFLAVLSACSHSGLVELGTSIFSLMGSTYEIEPKLEHYGCMVDLLGRSGYLQEAREIVRTMPYEANAAAWGSLLAASRIHGDTDLGEEALQHLRKLEPYNSGNFSLLSNLYADHCRWNESSKIRKAMRDSRTNKVLGGSSIELNNEVHGFVTEDKSHVHASIIYEELHKINGNLKAAKHLGNEYSDLLQFDATGM